MSLTYPDQCALEVRWYREHGKYDSRIRSDDLGMKYVVKDWAWNFDHRQAPERINLRMANYVVEQITGLKR